MTPPLVTRSHRAPFGPEGPALCKPEGFIPGIYPIVRLLAQHLDHAFQPPDTLIREESYYYPAAGCGGGRDLEQRGTAEQGLTWDDTLTEHAADESAHGEWTAYGLAGGCALSVGRYERGSGDYFLKVTGPVPQVDDVLEAWCALLERKTGVTAEHAREALAHAVASRAVVTLAHTYPIRPDGVLLCAPLGVVNGVYPIVRVLAQHLDPSYDPPDTVLVKEKEYTAAYGCGGGYDFEKRGDEQRFLSWYDAITEHSATDSAKGAWEACGLANGYLLKVGRDDGGSHCYTLNVTAPARLAQEVVAVWAALVKREPGVTVEHAREELARVIALRAPA